MRIRRKKNLEDRIKNVKEFLIETDTSVKNVKLAVEKKEYVNVLDCFGNNNPLCLEIGCGNGGFIIKTARKNIYNNYIAVEMIQNILVMAMEKAKDSNVKNLLFMNTGAEYLPKYIKPESVNKIFLNFSPPYPQKSYECRRLTNDRNVKNYYDFLIKGGMVIQKTDDLDFFNYSFEMFSKNGFTVIDTSSSLKTDINNVTTEYEEKFSSQGISIYRLVAIKN